MRKKNTFDAGDMLAVVIITIIAMVVLNTAITELLGV